MKVKLLALVHGEYVSHTTRFVEISKALRKTGNYDITFSGSGEYMKIAEDAGFRCVETETLSKTEINSVLAERFVPLMFTKEDAEKYYEIESELLKKHKPDIILRDHFRELAGVAAKKQGIYDVFIQLASCSPYYHFDFRPSSFPRILDIMLPEFITRPFRPLTQKYVRKKAFRPVLNQVKKQNLPVNKDVPEGYEADLVLLPDEEELFPFPERKEKYKYLGSLLFFDQSPSPEWLNSFIKDSRKKILITSGSTGLNDKTQMFVEAFQDNKFAVAIHTNYEENLRDFYGCNQFNISEVVPYVDAFVTHGGIGSTYLGLKYGIPMLVVPNHFEQEVNSVQLKKIGTCLWLPPKKLSSENIRKDIEKILQEPSFKKNAVAFSKTMTKDPLELAVKYIDEGYKEFRKN